jgi:hypothetical protein
MVCVPHLFVDPTKRDHVSDLFLLELPEIGPLAPVVNLVDIRQIGGDSLSTTQEESTGSTSSTRTHVVTNPYEEEFPAFPPGFRGAIFTISADEPSREGEIDQERAARVERNANRMARRVKPENAKEA